MGLAIGIFLMSTPDIAIAMDWGGTWTRTAVIDRQGEILWQSRQPNPQGGTKEEYLAGNLLQRPVTAQDVAWAFCDLARSRASTAAVLTVDGGNIAAAVR